MNKIRESDIIDNVDVAGTLPLGSLRPSFSFFITCFYYKKSPIYKQSPKRQTLQKQRGKKIGPAKIKLKGRW